MGKKDRAEKAIGQIAQTWVDPWCKRHQADLEEYRGFAVIVHIEHGIISAARTISELWTHAHYLKKRLLPGIAYVETWRVLPPLDNKREEPKDEDFPSLFPSAAPTVKTDPLDVEDQGPVPERADPPPPLDRAPDPFDNDVVLDGAPHPETNPFPSPDKQPPFMPHPSPGRSLVVDGAGGSLRRGLRFD
jgi:hypothetical protein